MREHIKLFEEQNEEIHEFMKNHGILKYEITPEGVDVHQDVWLSNSGLLELPFQFNIVHGYFNLRNSGLTSLRNAPRVVNKFFSCSNCNLKSLEFCPKFIGDEFFGYANQAPPWETRYLLFSEIHVGVDFEDLTLDRFFEKYQNKKALIPEALKVLKAIQEQWDQNA